VKLLRVLVLVVLAAPALVAVGAHEAVAASPERGGTLTTMEAADNRTSWDPIALLGIPQYDSPGSFAIYDTLFYEDPATLKLVYRLATSMTTSDGGTTWTLKLRPNVKFSDGTPFDAAAVQFNWQRIADPANKAFAYATAAPIQSMQVVDPLTLRATLNAPDPNWNHRVAYKLAAVGSPTAIKAEGANFGIHPVGAGPFILKEWVRNDHQTFVRNPDYWEKGRPYLDQIVHKFIADETTKYATFKTTPGSMDFVYSPDVIGEAKQDGYQVLTQAPNAGGWAMAFNTVKAPFNDARVRQAIALAIDQKQFNQTRRGGDKTLLMNTVEQPGTPYYDKNVAMPKTNLAAAQKLVDQVVAETGKPIEFTYAVFNTPYIVTDAQLLQAQVSKLKNVNMKVDVQASTLLIANFNSGNFQAYSAIPRWNLPAIDLTATFRSTSATNYWKYNNPTVDSELTQLVTSTDPKTSVQLVRSAEGQILKDMPVAWYTRYATYTIVDKSVKGLTAYYDQRFLLDNVWISNKK
jgi:peptide/nickel transport system substrate-binding protein